MFEVHEWRVLTPSVLAQRRVPGEGEVSDNDGCSQSIPADIQKKFGKKLLRNRQD